MEKRRAARWVLAGVFIVMIPLGLHPSVRRWYLARHGALIPVVIENLSCSARKCYADFTYQADGRGPAAKASTVVRRKRLRPGPAQAFHVPPGGGLFTGVELADDGGGARAQAVVTLAGLALAGLIAWRGGGLRGR